jgi:hypothetical protein
MIIVDVCARQPGTYLPAQTREAAGMGWYIVGAGLIAMGIVALIFGGAMASANQKTQALRCSSPTPSCTSRASETRTPPGSAVVESSEFVPWPRAGCAAATSSSPEPAGAAKPRRPRRVCVPFELPLAGGRRPPYAA